MQAEEVLYRLIKLYIEEKKQGITGYVKFARPADNMEFCLV